MRTVGQAIPIHIAKRVGGKGKSVRHTLGGSLVGNGVVRGRIIIDPGDRHRRRRQHTLKPRFQVIHRHTDVRGEGAAGAGVVGRREPCIGQGRVGRRHRVAGAGVHPTAAIDKTAAADAARSRRAQGDTQHQVTFIRIGIADTQATEQGRCTGVVIQRRGAQTAGPRGRIVGRRCRSDVSKAVTDTDLIDHRDVARKTASHANPAEISQVCDGQLRGGHRIRACQMRTRIDIEGNRVVAGGEVYPDN